jgi:hypothetical protein
MADSNAMGANQVLKELHGKPQAQNFSLLFNRLKEKYLVVVYIIAIVLWAVVIPMFSEPIIAFVKDLFGTAG